MRFFRLILLYVIALLARTFVRRPQRDARRILYIKPDHLGDLLLATPVLASLRQRFPEAQITALVGPWARMVLERNPDFDTLLTCPFPAFERAAQNQNQLPLVLRLASPLLPYVTLLRYAALLRATPYDIAIIGRDDHWWGAALALLAGIPLRIGFAVRECQPFLTNALPWNPDEHVTRQGLALVDALTKETKAGRNKILLSLKSSSNSAVFIPPPEDVAWANSWHATNLLPGEQLILIHPGTGGAAKHWLDDRWAVVADELAKNGSFKVVLTGGPGEEERVARVQQAMAYSALNIAGQTSVGQLAALMARATLVLGVDSGPLHLAAAVGTRTIHLYGPGDEQRFGPWGDPAKHMALHTELWCRPCGVFAACPRGLATPECMERITIQEVQQASKAVLAKE